MSPRDDFEDEIQVFRKNRRMIRLNNLHFRKTRKDLEAAITPHIIGADRAQFFWPPEDEQGKKHKQGDHFVMTCFQVGSLSGQLLVCVARYGITYFRRFISENPP